MTATYDVGDLVRLTAVFRDLTTGQLADPTTVELRVRANGVTTVYDDTVRDSTGTYHRDVTITKSGPTDYRWIGTGAVQAAALGRFDVHPTLL